MQALNSVLIETYWNVNRSCWSKRRQRRKVLIETYWNVNNFAGVNEAGNVASLNRNILECKSEDSALVGRGKVGS